MYRKILFYLLVAQAGMAGAQSLRSSSSMFLGAQAPADITVPFRWDATGERLPLRWGLDVAWLNEQNMRKGINFIGKENLSLARSSFQMNNQLVGDTALTSAQKKMLDDRTRVINLMSTTCDIVLNSDQGDGSTTYIIPWYASRHRANTAHWAQLIEATTAYMQKRYPKHAIVAVSPFNEPDYSSWNQGSKADYKEIARLLKENYPRFKDIAITAGNTLNDDQALTWYNAVKPYVTWGNTHQLAGSFDNFAAFWQQVRADGNYGYADELHNVGEAMVAANYGAQAGVWWGFDSRARGEFCRMSNHGYRLGYGENRDKWTAASVYRDSTGFAEAFVGGSERQATTSTVLFLSPGRDVYFDGEGPTRAFCMTYPGGTGYQQGQTNAERVYHVVSGADVPPVAIGEGTYKIMCKATRGLVSVYGTMGDNANVAQVKIGDKVKPSATSLWLVAPVPTTVGGDFSFLSIANKGNGKRINVLNNATYSGANLIAYDANNASNEQWAAEYAGKGWYRLRNRESGMYMSLASNSTANGTNICQRALASGTAADLQLWRLLPEKTPTEVTPPDAPASLTARAQTASVCLQWTPSQAGDVAGYEVLRAEKDGNDWNTIARGVPGNTFTDNTALTGVDYIYKVMAVDSSLNISAASPQASARLTDTHAMVARWSLNGSLSDESGNLLDAVAPAPVDYATGYYTETQAASLNGNFIQLPYAVGQQRNMTVAMWVKWTNSGKIWTRLFDFGNGTSQYMFLTPSNGSVMRLALKNGGDEQTLDAPVLRGGWHHVAVTLATDSVTLWVDGSAVASSSAITIRPADFLPVLNYLGRSQFAADPLFEGQMADVRVYNYALSPLQVQQIAGSTTAIAKVETMPERGHERSYNLQGRSMSRSDKGLHVYRGRKVLVK